VVLRFGRHLIEWNVELIVWKWYGYVEGIGGAVKLILVLSGVIFMIVDASKGMLRSSQYRSWLTHSAVGSGSKR
jgi:hypothetical protein